MEQFNVGKALSFPYHLPHSVPAYLLLQGLSPPFILFLTSGPLLWHQLQVYLAGSWEEMQPEGGGVLSFGN